MNDLPPGNSDSCAVSFSNDATIFVSANFVSFTSDTFSNPLSWNDVSPPLTLVAEVVLTLALMSVCGGKLCDTVGTIV